MVPNMERYEAMLRDFQCEAKKHITPATLEQLKSHYKEAINSVRTFDRIQNIEYLIRVLGNRGVICDNNTIPLKYMAREYFKHSPINEQLDQYDAWYRNHTPLYPPHTNLYQLPNGESCLTNRHFNDLSSNYFKKRSLNDLNIQSCFEYKFTCKLPLRVISNENLNNRNDSIISINSFDDQWDTKVSFHNNFTRNDNRSIGNIIENRDKQKLHVVHNLTIPSKLLLKNEQVVISQNNSSIPLSVEKNSETNDTMVETFLLPIPQTPKSQTICTSQIDTNLSDESLRNLGVKKNVAKKNSFRELIRKKTVQMIFVVLSLVALLTMLFIIYNLFGHSVQYNAEPSAPPIQEHVNAHISNIVPWNSNRVTGLQDQPAVSNAICFPVIPRTNLRVLSKMEEMKQQMVFERVGERMGSYWRDIARHLDVKEFEIDKIESYSNCSLPVKAYTVLKIFARDCNPDNWQLKLIKALRKARRTDLSEYVEELLSW